MKTSIKLTALFLLASTSIFAATPSKSAPAKADLITFSSLPAENGVDIKVEKNAPGKTVVMIYDEDGNVLRKDILADNKSTGKSYNFSKLDVGDYKIEVTSNKQVVTKEVHVYDEYQTKTFFIKN